MSTEELNDKLLSLRNEAGNQSLLVRIESFIGNVSEIVARSESLVPTAEEFTIESETEFQFADDLRVALDQEAKNLDNQRLQLTRPIDDLKNYVMAQVKPAIDNNKAAAAIYGRKALDYRREQQRIAREAQQKAEAEQRRKQDELNAAAARREAEANKLKTEAARKRAQAEADALRQAALTTPVQMAVSAPAPQSTSSNVVEKWLWEIQNWPAYLRWLADHPEWLNEKGNNNIVVGPMKAAMNKFANHYTDSIKIPGVHIYSEEAFRKKAQRGT